MGVLLLVLADQGSATSVAWCRALARRGSVVAAWARCWRSRPRLPLDLPPDSAKRLRIERRLDLIAVMAEALAKTDQALRERCRDHREKSEVEGGEHSGSPKGSEITRCEHVAGKILLGLVCFSVPAIDHAVAPAVAEAVARSGWDAVAITPAKVASEDIIVVQLIQQGSAGDARRRRNQHELRRLALLGGAAGGALGGTDFFCVQSQQFQQVIATDSVLRTSPARLPFVDAGLRAADFGGDLGLGHADSPEIADE